MRSDLGSVQTWRQALVVCCLLFTSCGKMGNPVPPEKLNPKPIESIAVVPSAEQITITWLAPTEDDRGEQLTRLDGYHVYRREVAALSELSEGDFDLFSTLEDSSMVSLEEQRAEALRTGVPLRKVSLSEEERLVTFTDNTVEPGKIYIYKILPYNQRWFEGRSKQLVKVVFAGEASDVQLLGKSEEEELLELDQELLPEAEEETFLNS